MLFFSGSHEQLSYSYSLSWRCCVGISCCDVVLFLQHFFFGGGGTERKSELGFGCPKKCSSVKVSGEHRPVLMSIANVLGTLWIPAYVLLYLDGKCADRWPLWWAPCSARSGHPRVFDVEARLEKENSSRAQKNSLKIKFYWAGWCWDISDPMGTS